jgi:FkbH-like protein
MDWSARYTLEPGLPIELRQRYEQTLEDLVAQGLLVKVPHAPRRGETYRVPQDLVSTATRVRRFLVVGSCAYESFHEHVRRSLGVEGEFLPVGPLGELPPAPAQPIDRYDFQIVHCGLRELIPDTFLRDLQPGDLAAQDQLFRDATAYVDQFLFQSLKWNREHGLLTFVLGFMTPQHHPMGRFAPRDDSTDLAYVIQQLNRDLRAQVARYQDAYFLDTDAIVSSFGKRFVQDDVLWISNHNSFLSDFDHDLDRGRLEPPAPIDHWFEVDVPGFLDAVWREIIAMFRTLRQIDAVKLVVIDLDDTIWRGVLADDGIGTLEGWPLGLIEALTWLKKRGILLAIVSKNPEELVRTRFHHAVWGRISLDDFVLSRVNFESKVRNLEEIMRLTNLPPRNVVMIDDNPSERDAIERAFPEMRVLGRDLYYLRSVLLWSAETQAPFLSEESQQKAAMVRGQIQREELRPRLSREDFLRSLAFRVSISQLGDTTSAAFERALELFNKTNQFNTTGHRYSRHSLAQIVDGKARLILWSAADRFTDYGIIGAAWLREHQIGHLVMSCRVIGLEIETAVLAAIGRRLRAEGVAQLEGILLETPSNLACRQLYANAGFAADPTDSTRWVRTLTDASPRIPPHVRLEEHWSDR